MRSAVKSSTSRRRGGDGSGGFAPWTIAVLFAVLAAMASIPVLTTRVPPLQDYVNHLARMHVIESLGRDPLLSNFYEVHWSAIPNLIMDLIVPVIGRFMSVYAAGDVFLILIFVLMLSGALAFNRALYGFWSATPLIAAALLYNGVLLVGVVNYLFGIGVALWALASWVWLREHRWPWRYLASLGFVLVLYFCHLFAAGVYGVGLLAFELHRLWNSKEKLSIRRGAEFVSAGIPFLAVLPLIYLSPTFMLVKEYDWLFGGKFEGVVLSFRMYHGWIAVALAAAVAAALALAAHYRVLHFHNFGWFVLVVGGIVYLAMPRMLFATYMADQRLPIGLAFLIVASMHIELKSQRLRSAFVALLLLLPAVRVAEVQATWDRLSEETVEFRNSVNEIARGSRVIVVYGGKSEGARDLVFTHAACLAMIERSSLVTTAFTVKGKHILQVRSAYSNLVEDEDHFPPNLAQFLSDTEREVFEVDDYWHNWPRRFDYVYILFTEPGARNPDPSRLRLVKEGPRFQLYRVIPKTVVNVRPR